MIDKLNIIKIVYVNFKGFITKIYIRLNIFMNDFPYRKYTKKYKCIFIHIPKNAGTSVLTSLMGDNIKREHTNYFDYQRADILKFESYFKFCFVRNPYDRMVSIYEYLKKGGNKKGDLFLSNLLNDKYKSFDDFVLKFLDKDIINEHVLFKPQYLFIYDYKYELQVDFVGRFENINADFNFVSEQLGVSFDLPIKNKSVRLPYEKYYCNSDVSNKIFYLYNKDFLFFGYKKSLNNK